MTTPRAGNKRAMTTQEIMDFARPHLSLCTLTSANCCSDSDCLARKIHCNHLFRDLNLYHCYLVDRYMRFLPSVLSRAEVPARPVDVRSGYGLFYREREGGPWEFTGSGPLFSGPAPTPPQIALVEVVPSDAAAGEYLPALVVAQRPDVIVLPLTDGGALLTTLPWVDLFRGWNVVVRSAVPRLMAVLLCFHVVLTEDDGQYNVARTLMELGLNEELTPASFIFELQLMDALVEASDPEEMWARLRGFEGERMERLGAMPPLRPVR